MNRWARIQLAIVAIGTLIFGIAAAQGFRVEADRAGFALHTQLGLVATLLVLLGESWVVVYLAASRLRLAKGAELGAGELRMLRRATRGAAIGAAMAAAAALAHLIWAGRGFAAGAPPARHGLYALATGLLLLLSLWLAAGGLTRHQRLVERIRAARCMLDSAGS